MAGVPLTPVKKLLVHKTLAMTLRYSHLSQNHKKQVSELTGDLCDGDFLKTLSKKVGVGYEALNHTSR
jgi:hypothetical protein